MEIFLVGHRTHMAMEHHRTFLCMSFQPMTCRAHAAPKNQTVSGFRTHNKKDNFRKTTRPPVHYQYTTRTISVVRAEHWVHQLAIASGVSPDCLEGRSIELTHRSCMRRTFALETFELNGPWFPVRELFKKTGEWSNVLPDAQWMAQLSVLCDLCACVLYDFLWVSSLFWVPLRKNLGLAESVKFFKYHFY